MRALERLTEKLAVTLALLGTLGIVAIVLHVSLDIILRSTIRVSMPATLEMVTRYYMMLLALVPLAWVERNNDMIAVELFSGLWGPAQRRWLDVAIALFSVVIYLFFTWATWGKAVEQWSIGAYVTTLDKRLPVWPTYFILPVSFGLAALVCALRSLRGLIGLPLASSQPQQDN